MQGALVAMMDMQAVTDLVKSGVKTVMAETACLSAHVQR